MARIAGSLTGSGRPGGGGSVEKSAAGSTLGRRLRQFVAVSYACAARSTVASSNGRPTSCNDSGKRTGVNPMHCASAGPPVTLNGVVSDEFCQKLMVRQVPSRGAGPGAAEEVGAEIAGASAQLLLMDGVLLAFGNRDLDGVVIGGRADAGVFEGRAKRAKYRVRLVEGGPHLRRDDRVVLVQMPDDADPQSPEVAILARSRMRGCAECAG